MSVNVELEFANCSLQDAVKKLMEHPNRTHHHVHLARWLDELRLMRDAMDKVMEATAPVRMNRHEEFQKQYEVCNWHRGPCEINHGHVSK